MDTNEIAAKLVEHCKNGTEAEGLKTLYAPDAQSIEPMAPEGMDPVSSGVEAIQGKHDWWNGAFEVHDVKMEGPFVNADKFTVIFEMDCTEKSSGNRWQAKEIALYEVEGGKISRETFMMQPMG